MDNTQKLRRTIEYALSSPSLAIEFKRALSELLSPENLAIAASVLVVWAASHFFGVGEVVDVILVGVAYVSIGAQGVQGLADLVEFGYDVINARRDFDLRRASEKLVRAFVLLGVEVVVALLTRRAQIKPSSAAGAPGSGGPVLRSNAPPRPPEPPPARHPQQQSYVGKLDKTPVELPGVYTQKINYVKRDPVDAEQLRNKFDSSVRRNFAKSLAGSSEKVAQLKKAGLSDVDIAKLGDGRIPSGYQVHHKLPLDDGGTNDFDNLVLIKNHPYHKVLTNAQGELTGGLDAGQSRLVDFPVVDGFIYPP
ncbi:HNH endonuclease signature motif containing protein [Hyalangium gracile]|uniref:HNH endonuclease signature motif containing protein n=1 Tax=Hyalangium gracile TaxID=394092 RepID=UPI001CCA8F95|nr:HNH endonuclease signature motif containing protein [Hyalangium gracile]